MKKIGLLISLICVAGFSWAAQKKQYIGQNKLYYGVSYYPEAWDEKNIEDDIARMKELNMNVIRMAEFAWHKMEPQEGQYDFAWLHKIIEKLHANGIDVILGTPTATPPAWLGDKYPEIYVTTEEGQQLTHGARRNCSYTNAVYRRYSVRICEEMAKEFGHKAGVIGWQTDNEFNLSPDYSEETRAIWIDWLKERYKTIDNLNKTWCLELWSQAYSNFEQIPMPKKSVWHHTSLRFAWLEFNNQMIAEFQDLQLKALRKYSDLPITHDGMPGQTVDYEKLFVDLDFAAVNNYHSFEAYDLIQSNYDRMRGFGKGYHWLFETAPNNSGGGDNGSTWFLHQHPGSMKAALWMNYALGAQGAMFWLWRQQWAGQETTHGAVLSAWGKPAANWNEIKSLGQELATSSSLLMENPVKKADVAIVYSHLANNGLSVEKYANDLKYYRDWTYRFYRPMSDSYIFRDVIYPSADISSYKLIFMPLLPYISQEFQDRLKKWVENGGVLLLGPMSGYRTSEWTQFTDRQMGEFENWTGITVESFLPIGTQRREKEIPFMLSFAPFLQLGEHEASLWSLALSSKNGTVLSTYTTGHHKDLPAIIENKKGKGKVVLLGTDPGKDAIGKLLLHYAAEVGVTPDAVGDSEIVVVPRKGKTDGYILVNIASETKSLKLRDFPFLVKDVLTGESVDCNKSIILQPYETKLLFK